MNKVSDKAFGGIIMLKDGLLSEFSKEILEQLPKGILLTVQSGDRLNVMTIGWGSMGIIWGKPVFTLLVRGSRYSYELLEKSQEFTINVPVKKDLKHELMLCGTKSGRDIDKFRECGLTPEKSRELTTPVIKECSLYLECKVVYKQAMDENLIDQKVKKSYYPQGDFHVMYYGEIIAAYK